jgi:U3 small nucleolar RNA-associated protein 18
MPKAVKQKTSKRVKTRSPFENTQFAKPHEDEDVDMDGAGQEEDEEDIPEKDDAEQKLEKLLFGDDEGFHSALREQQDSERGIVMADESDEKEDADAAEEDEDEAGERDLGDVPDADVCVPGDLSVGPC